MDQGQQARSRTGWIYEDWRGGAGTVRVAAIQRVPIGWCVCAEAPPTGLDTGSHDRWVGLLYGMALASESLSIELDRHVKKRSHAGRHADDTGHRLPP